MQIISPFIPASIAALVTISMKIFDLRWDREAKALSVLLDIDNKMEHSNLKVKGLLELSEAKFLIRNEQRLHTRAGLHHTKLGFLRTTHYYLARYLLAPLSAFIGSFILSALTWLLFPSIASTPSSFVGLYLLANIVLSLIPSHFFGNALTPWFMKKYEASLKGRGDSRLRTDVRLRVKAPSGEIYDFIGIPELGSIDIYKRSKNTDTLPIEYVFQYRREMTPLEIEWSLSLNAISDFLRRTTRYIPYTTADGKISHSAYYLVWK